ncbi:response regulator [Porphyromonas sp. COT-108 OH1349]|uniref:response regulator n=1 Tax=Porphyromonas sp. COT-108 OH1349 TaxID=1537504 RepID=UPI00052B86FF|nr:response regulator [Porphyromonas sp. COT-108 OH1349]KGN67065.1 hypothetical protein JT26_10190 [Porphyromonas sp. COT-108 OH1349]
MIRFLYISSRVNFVESLIRQQELSEQTEIIHINTSEKSIADVINELKSNSQQFESYIIELESVFKDEKILGESPGIELIKHILLTESLREKRSRKIIALSFFNLHYLIKQNPDNIILNAPSISLIDLVLSPRIMLDSILKAYASYEIDFLKEEEDFEKNLLNYIVITEDERAKHDYHAENFFGLQRLYREFYYLKEHENYPRNYEERLKYLLEKEPLFATDSNILLHKKLMLKHKIKALRLEQVIESQDIKLLLIDNKEYWAGFFQQIFGDSNVTAFTRFNKDSNISNQSVWEFISEYKKSIQKSCDSLLGVFSKNIQKCHGDEYIDEDKREKKFNFVFLDIRLLESDSLNKNYNDLSGIKLLKKIRSINSLLPVCVFTTSEDPISIRYAFKYGCSAYFNKGKDSLFSLYGLIHSNMTDWLYNKAIGELLFILGDKEIKVPKLTRKSSSRIRYHEKEEYELYIEEITEAERNTLIGRIDEVLHKIQKNNMDNGLRVEGENSKVFAEIAEILCESLGFSWEKGCSFDFSYQFILQRIEHDFKDKGEANKNVSKRSIRFNNIEVDFISHELLYNVYKPFLVRIESIVKDGMLVSPCDILGNRCYYVEKSQVEKVYVGKLENIGLKKGGYFTAIKRKNNYIRKNNYQQRYKCEIIDFYEPNNSK